MLVRPLLAAWVGSTSLHTPQSATAAQEPPGFLPPQNRLQNSSNVTFRIRSVTQNRGMCSQPFPWALHNTPLLPECPRPNSLYLTSGQFPPAAGPTTGSQIFCQLTFTMTFSLPLLPCDSLTQTPGSPVCLRTGNGFTRTVAKVLPEACGKASEELSVPWCPFNPAGETMKLQLPALIPWISKHWATLGLNTFLLAARGPSSAADALFQHSPPSREGFTGG